MSKKEPIKLELPEGFDIEAVKKAITDEFVQKLADEFAQGTTEVAVTTKKESPPSA